MHQFFASVTWKNDGKPFTAKEYSRQYLVQSPGKPDFMGTAAPAFMGSPYHYNPEDLMVASLSACHMLTFLAYAAAAKLVVVEYQDHAEGLLFTDDSRKTRFEKVVLKPKVIFEQVVDEEKLNALHDKAHHACFIANSVNFAVTIEPVL